MGGNLYYTKAFRQFIGRSTAWPVPSVGIRSKARLQAMAGGFRRQTS